jgi:hypothetical protein
MVAGVIAGRTESPATAKTNCIYCLPELSGCPLP